MSAPFDRMEYHRHDTGEVVAGPAIRCIDPDAGAHDVFVLTRGESVAANTLALNILAEKAARIRNLVSDWQANGNSRELGDPTAATWHQAARQLLDVLDGEPHMAALDLRGQSGALR